MRQLDFEIDWTDAEGINGPELSATWASLKIRAGDSVITSVLDTRARTVRDFVHVPLYPLAEWLVTNWWFLTCEFENPIKEGDPGFHRRHALGPSREGYAFPNLKIVSSGARTHLCWTGESSPWTRVTFLNQGETWIDSSQFREICAALIDRVIRRLVSLDIDNTLLQEEWAAIQAADEEEVRFCGIAAGLGWDPYDLSDAGSDWIHLLAEKLGDMLDEAIPALDTQPMYLSEGLNAITDAVAAAKRRSLPLERLRSLRDDVCRNGKPEDPNPWETGYGWARRLRRKLDLDGDALPTMKKMADALGENGNSIDHVTKPNFNYQTTLVDGVITWNDDDNPAFAFRQRGDHGRRFSFCRALAEVLAHPGSDTLLTRAHSERQQRNRAFAAEFLAPSAGLRKMISRSVLDDEDIDELAVEYGVSSRVIEHQIMNHRIARIR